MCDPLPFLRDIGGEHETTSDHGDRSANRDAERTQPTVTRLEVLAASAKQLTRLAAVCDDMTVRAKLSIWGRAARLLIENGCEDEIEHELRVLRRWAEDEKKQECP